MSPGGRDEAAGVQEIRGWAPGRTGAGHGPASPGIPGMPGLTVVEWTGFVTEVSPRIRRRAPSSGPATHRRAAVPRDGEHAKTRRQRHGLHQGEQLAPAATSRGFWNKNAGPGAAIAPVRPVPSQRPTAGSHASPSPASRADPARTPLYPAREGALHQAHGRQEWRHRPKKAGAPTRVRKSTRRLRADLLRGREAGSRGSRVPEGTRPSRRPHAMECAQADGGDGSGRRRDYRPPG